MKSYRNISELTPEYRRYLKEKYNIQGSFQLVVVDQDFELLEEFLLDKKKESYDANDRFVVEHFDTDYYLPEFPYGLGIYNLFTCWRKLDLPLFTMLIVTNSFGIRQEIEALAPDPNDRPTVIETFVSRLHWIDNYKDADNTADHIEIAGISMLGQLRVHRSALYRFIEREKLFDSIAVSINNDYRVSLPTT